MNLYFVQLHSVYDSIWVYVVAADPNEAQNKAINKMRDLDWKYTSYAGNVELIALANKKNGKELLIT